MQRINREARCCSDQTRVASGCFADLEAPSATVSNDGRCRWLGLPADWRTTL